MRNLSFSFVAFLLLPFALNGCGITTVTKGNTAETAEMNRLEIAVRRLGAAAQGLLWVGTPPDADLIDTVCQHDRSLCSSLRNNSISIRVVDGHAVLLLCTSDGSRALVEDIACTPIPDLKVWKERDAPCKFTLSDQAVLDACQ